MAIQVEVQFTDNGKRGDSQFSTGTSKSELQRILGGVREQLIVIAKNALAEEQRTGFPKNPITVVDNSTSKKVEDVNTLGKIQFLKQQQDLKVVQQLYTKLLETSPVDTGAYQRAHIVLLNGKQVASDLVSLNAFVEKQKTLVTGDTLLFVNTQPYARKLERLGISANRRAVRVLAGRKRKGVRGGSIIAPNGVYYLAAKSITRDNKFFAQIKFQFVTGTQLGLTALNQKFRSRKNVRAGRPLRTYLYPSIEIKVTQGGNA